MRIVRIVLGWLLAAGGVAAAALFTFVLWIGLGFQSFYTYRRWGWILQDWVIAAGIFLSLIVAVAGYWLARHKFGINSVKDRIISVVIIASLAAWAIVGYFVLIYQWR
ncbi:MAG: hypothetical protein NTZ34_06840 [Chloroflexi bacterium]|nr:hypothetical protein [Chloroflexota bacterium]